MSSSSLKPHSLTLTLIVAWLFAAAFAQLLFLAYWPLHVLGVPVVRLPAVLVALVRLGFYTGLGWGLWRGQRLAWSATILELGRSLLFFTVPVVFGGAALAGSVYPTAWAQGLLTAALPLLFPLDAALAAGWRPPLELEHGLALVLRFWGALAGVAAIWLRRSPVCMEVPPERQWQTLLREGLPLVLLLAAVECAALFWSLVVTRS